jgi:hypothetical protein
MTGKAKIGLPLIASLVGALAGSAQAQGTLLTAVSLPAPAPALPAPLSTPTLPASTPSLPAPTPRAVPQPSSTSTPAPRLPSVSVPSGPSISTSSTPEPTAPAIHVSASPSPVPSVSVSSSVTPSKSVSGPAPGPIGQALPITGTVRGASAPASNPAAGSASAAHSPAAGTEASRGLQALGAGSGGGPGGPFGVGAWRRGSGYGTRAVAAQLAAFASSLAHTLAGLGQIGGAGPSAGGAVHATPADRGATPSASSAKDPLGLELPPETGQAMMVAMIALGAMLLLGVLFSDELQQLLSRLTQRPRS